MDFERLNQPAASSSSSHTQNNALQVPPFSERTLPLRSSSRIKAAKEKGKEKEENSHSSSEQSSSRRTREHIAKGKTKDIPTEHVSAPVRSSKRTKRSTQPPTTTSLVFSEPTKDAKGKKRAVPDSISDDESTPTSSKRARRSKKGAMSQMSKKTTARPSPNGKNAAKSKSFSAPGPSRPDEDEQMMDVDYELGAQDHDEPMHGDDDHSDDDEMEKSEDEEHDGGNEKRGEPPTEASESRRSLEETMAMFDFGRMGGFMSQVNTRLRTLLNNIKATADPTTRLVALQELSELLSISTEDTLAGSFQIESFVRELVRILGGNGGEAAQDEADDDDEGTDEDAALAAALAMSSGGAYAGDENLEAQLLACRCLANLMEALPGCGHTLVYHGAIPVLCSKLVEISYIDLAEQTLLTLEKISEEYPSAIVREGGLAALLNYLDFFSIAVQRTALQAAANCCRNFSPDHFAMIKDVWPIIRNCLGYADQRLVDYAALCVIRIIESYHRSHADKLEVLVDADLIRAVNVLLLPAGGSPVVNASTYTQIVKVLGTAARASPSITLTLLQADIVTTIYQILTGVLPPSSAGAASEQGGSASGQGLGGGLADMTVMQNLAHRPKEQVEEALTLVSELMPPLPKDGTFDHRGYSGNALHRMIKAKNKADRAAARAAAANATNAAAFLSGGLSAASSRAQTPTPGLYTPGDDESGTPASAPEPSESFPVLPLPGRSTPETATAVDRATLLRQHEQIVNRFITPMVPILVDVYAASVSGSVKLKALTSLLKAICFQDEEQLIHTLKNVPIASFASSILSAKDNPNLMIGGLQLVELLLSKAPTGYRASFRREGVLHEIETLAARPLPPRVKEKEKAKEDNKDDSVPSSDTPVSVPIPAPVGSSSRRPHLIDPEDAYTLRARVIKLKYLTNDVQDEGDATFTRLRHLVTGLKQSDASEQQLVDTLEGLSRVFSSHQTVSSFELLQSGLLDGLLEFTTSKEYAVDLARRQELLMEKLAAINDEKTAGLPPLAILVKKLQESLSRIESFEVTTVAPGMEDSKRSTPSLLARQIKLRLIPEDSSDSSSSNLVVSIHAIATFQALNDYLRPRLTGLLSTSVGSRLSGMLSALAAGRFGPDVLSAGGFGGFSRALGSTPPPPQAQSQIENQAQGGSAPGDLDRRPERRRSQRLSAKASAASISERARTQASSSAATPSATSTSTVFAPKDKGKKATSRSRSRKNSSGDREDEETVANDDDLDSEGDFMDADVDAEVFDGDGDHDHNDEAEKTVTLSLADDGSKVVAQTPEGTRVATPNPAASAGPSTSPSNAKSSYAAALKSKPSDWHLEFSMDDHVLPLDMTIYGAIHQHEARKETGSSVPLSMLYSSVFPVKYKKVPGSAPPPENNGETSARARSPISALASLPDDAPHSKILKLLRVLHRWNSEAAENAALLRILPENAFINNKLTAKLTRQLEEPMIVASSCLPEWAMDLPLHFPFLFPFSTRFNFLQSTSFGYARLILKWQSQNRAQESSRRDEQLGFLGRLQRQKVRISRKHILESAFKVFELYGSSSSILEVEYFDEVGTGLGPTLEFYSLVSREFARRDLKIWRDEDVMYPGIYVHHPHGLFPAPVATDSGAAEGGEKRMYIFKIIGQFVAKAMLDSRIIDMSFNRIFLKMILGEEIPLTIATLRLVDPALANSLAKLEAFVQPREFVKASMDLGTVEDMMLDFTLPGYEIELRPGGKNIPVTSANVREYIQEVINATIGRGAELQARAFREGFSKVFPVADLLAFSADELGVLFGNAVEDWTVDTLMESMKADHGFNMESPAIRDLVAVISNYDEPSRRRFLQFITGSPKLPIGGFRGLNPPFTVVRKPHEPPLSADDYLPSVMTCVNYLKLPQYSSRDVMRERLETAMSEGVGCFHLS